MTDLTALGVTQDKLLKLVVDQICDDFMGLEYSSLYDEITSALKRQQKEAIDNHIEKLHREVVIPMVEKGLDEFIIQHTNAYGEKKGEPETLTEHVTKLAESYLNEKVGLSGRSQREDGRLWNGGKSTRIEHMVDKHLHYHIEHAVKGGLKDINSKISTSLSDAIRNAVDGVAKNLNVYVAK